jgi:hypothetical protein
MRSYKCPGCMGEFNEWDKMERLRLRTDEIEPTYETVDVCPFCRCVRGQFRGSAHPIMLHYNVDYKTQYTECPVCGAKGGEQCCLTIHCCKASPDGTANIHCTCPRCTPRC